MARTSDVLERKRIVREIKRLAERNGGVPPGQRLFELESGIKSSQWRGRYWARWGDAVREAGLEPNVPKQAYGAQRMIDAMIPLVRRLQRLPTWAEWNLEHRTDATFPSMSVFRRAGMGTTRALAAGLIDYCESRDGFEDVLALCAAASPTASVADGDGEREGTVYLIKSGRYYKIGRAFAIGRRAREIALQLPERAITVHLIRTDDPVGIEAYWHRRFEAKRANGEWFALTGGDIRAFKRRKTFM
jgi:hypothetical protein